MIEVRRAGPGDVAEVVRLRGVMLTAMGEAVGSAGPWVDSSAVWLRERLADPDVAIVVVSKPDRPGELATCAVGTIERYLGDPENPGGLRGRVFNVATDAGYRRRGYARACLVTLLDWFDGAGVPAVDLSATPEGEPLYQELGFVARTWTAMRRSAEGQRSS